MATTARGWSFATTERTELGLTPGAAWECCQRIARYRHNTTIRATGVAAPQRHALRSKTLIFPTLSLAEIALAVEFFGQQVALELALRFPLGALDIGIEGGEMNKIPVRDRELVAALLRDKIARPLGDDALQELAGLYSQLSEGLAALDTLDLSHVDPAVSFVMSEAEGDED